MRKRWMGLDIGGTKCAVLLAEVNHGIRILDKRRFATESGFEATWERLCETVEAVRKDNSLEWTDIEAIGVSCGGPLDSRRGIVLNPPNLPGWVDIPLVKMLEDRFGVPAFLQNDANACALVEWKLGAGRGTDNMVFLTMGTGMGGGVIAEGQLLVGNTNMGGEVGHLRLAEDGPVGFGKAGSFEGFTSGGGITRQAQALTARRIEEGNPPKWFLDGYTIEETDTKLMAEYARSGDADALALFDRVGRMLGRGLALIVDSFNPEKIVIGSVFLRCEDLLRKPMEEELRREAIDHALEGLEVVAAGTGEAIGDYAAILTALYAYGVDPMEAGDETDDRVLKHYERLFERYPQLEGCRQSVMDAYELLLDCYRKGGKLMMVGNGGSCADCEHIAGELMKGFYLKRPLPEDLCKAIDESCAELLEGAGSKLQMGLPAIALTGHAALSTAVQNDNDPLLGPAQQVMALGKPGDVVMGISTSGNAKNAALAVQVAKARGMKTLGLAGGSGGRLAKLCDCAVVVPGNCPADVQELHLPVYHTLCAMLEAKMFADQEV